MQFLKNLNKTTKILILVIYTLILLMIAFGVSYAVNKPAEKFSDYFDTPGDENIAILFRLNETRTPGTTGKESASWQPRLTLQKISDATIIKVHSFITIETVEGDFLYKEETPFESLTSLKTQYFRTGETLKKTNVYNTQTQTYTKTNREPARVFIEIVYKTYENNNLVYKNIKYKIDLLKENNYDFSQFETRNVNENGYVINENELYKLKFTKQEEANSSGNIGYRAYLEKNNNTSPANIHITVFAKAENDPTDTENYFSDYIQMVQYYGNFVNVSIPNLTSTYSESYQISALYVVSEVIPEAGNSTISSYTINIDNLPTY